MCGVIGVVGSPEAAKETFLGLVTLQHRGQDAAGILSYDHVFHEAKNLGLVESVFSRETVDTLTGSTALGHTRYSTVGKGELRDVQPFILNYPYGLGLVHNGNIVNYYELKERLQSEMRRRCFTNSDSETILNWIAHNLEGTSFANLKKAILSVYKNIHGSYSVAGILGEGGLFAFRDPFGIRPLVLGKKTIQTAHSTSVAYMVASETLALTVNGYEVMRDLKPGELFYFQRGDRREEGLGDVVVHSEVLDQRGHRPCMFEWVYFASAESDIESTPVYGARLALGKALALLVKERMDRGEIVADLVAPVPDTSRTAASALAESLGLPYREVLIKNRYIKRTFILGSDEQRKRSVDLKLNPVVSEIRGKNIILVDDSIVRGTTSKKIIDLVKRAGARKVYFLSTCPPIRYPCFYGIDFPDQGELIAAGKSEAEIAKALGADGVLYLELPGLMTSLKESSQGRVSTPCAACLTGEYPADVSASQEFARMRRHERRGSQ